MKLSEITKSLDGIVHGADIEISGISTPDEQKTGTICVISEKKYLKTVGDAAVAYVIPGDLEEFFKNETTKPYIVVKNTKFAMINMINLFFPEEKQPAYISDKAVVSDKTVIGKNATIEPFAVIHDGVVIGDNVRIHSGVSIAKNVTIGDNCTFYPNVVIYADTVIGNNVAIHAGAVIGGDGFGYVAGIEHTKIPHKGNVVIGDNVEIGCNTTVDRATLSSTVIGKGTKLDNLVHIGHNVKIGKHCFIAGQSGIGGSSILGDYIVMGGQVGVADHTKIGDQARFAGNSGVATDIPAGQTSGGSPAVPASEWLKQSVLIGKLGELRSKVLKLEKICEKKGSNDE